ncbi:MAG: Hint domain-containing protein [Roseovarius sp.]
MSFTFSIIEWASVNDPGALFRQSGTLEGDSGSGGTPGVTQVSFGATSTQTITTATTSGDPDYPDDGGARLDQDVTLNGTTYTAGADVEADFEVILVDPNTGYYFRATWLAIDDEPVGISLSRAWDASTGEFVSGAAGKYVPGTQLTLIDGDDLDGTPNIGNFATDSNYTSDGIGNDAELNDANGGAICFAGGTLIKTRRGEVPVENLQVGVDEVLTLDQGYKHLRWIGSRHLSEGMLAAYPNLRPVRIRCMALGVNLPERDLVVSPQHRIMLRSKVAARMFGVNEILVPAKDLLALDGIETAEDIKEVTYWHFMCDEHQVVFANGAIAESLYAGPEAIKSLDSAAREEILTIFTELGPGAGIQPIPARLIAKGRRVRHLADRIARNRKPLVACTARGGHVEFRRA